MIDRVILSHLTPLRVWNWMATVISFYSSRIFPFTYHPASPVSLSIEPTTSCNLGCPECPSGLKIFHRPTGQLLPEQFAQWLPQLQKRAIWVNFYFQGEPMLNKNIFTLIRQATDARLYTCISTNGHFMHDENVQSILNCGLKLLIISLDGVTQSTYENYRIHGSLNTVIEGTKRIVAARNSYSKSKLKIVFQFLVTSANENDIDKAKAMARDIGVDEIRFKTTQVYDYINGNSLLPKNEKFSRYVRLSDGTFKVKNSLDNHCWRMWSGTVITWNGEVVPCCFDKDAEHSMGNLNNHSLNEIWNNSTYRKFRAALFKSRSSHAICTNCSEGTKVWAVTDIK
ncbi:MAG: radical SAM/SPASM domain-containing protein [Flavobacteriales bacterium]